MMLYVISCVILRLMVFFLVTWFLFFFFFSSRRRHTRYIGDWSSDVCSSDLAASGAASVHGRVTKSLGEPAVGAPVYLEAVDPISKQRLVDLRKMLTDKIGRASCRERV